MNPDGAYFVIVNGTQQGPVYIKEIRLALKRFKIGAETLVWQEGWEEWKRLDNLPVFNDTISRLPAQPVARYKNKWTATALAFFGGLIGAHRIYLGQWWWIFYPAYSAAVFFPFITDPSFFIFILFLWSPLIIISVLEGIAFAVTGQERWDAFYKRNEWGVYTPTSPKANSKIILGFLVLLIASLIYSTAEHYNYRESLQSCGDVKTDLANLAIAEEAYFADHGKYFAANIKDGKPDKIQDVENFPHERMSVIVEPKNEKGRDFFVAKGYSEKCQKIKGSFYLWDSSKGGLQEK